MQWNEHATPEEALPADRAFALKIAPRHVFLGCLEQMPLRVLA